MDYGLSGRVAFVGGGSKGCGRATAALLAAEGCRVAVIARGGESIDETVSTIVAAGGEAIGITCDLSDPRSVHAAIGKARTRLGPIDIAIYNGVTPIKGTFEEVSEADFLASYHMLVTGFAAMVRAASPDMKARRWGRIVTIGSRAVKQPLRTHEVPYVLANTHRIAAVGLSKTLANELGPYGITVNTIATGRFDTDTHRAHIADTGDQAGVAVSGEEYLAARLQHIPLRRLGKPEEMAALVAFLCSRGGSYITGETICHDGGRNESML